MDKYDSIKMLELVKVEDSDSGSELTLFFQEDKTLKIKIVDGKGNLYVASIDSEDLQDCRLSILSVDQNFGNPNYLAKIS